MSLLIQIWLDGAPQEIVNSLLIPAHISLHLILLADLLLDQISLCLFLL